MMNRRSFLRTLGLGIVCAPVLVKAVKAKEIPLNSNRASMTYAQADKIAAETMKYYRQQPATWFETDHVDYVYTASSSPKTTFTMKFCELGASPASKQDHTVTFRDYAIEQMNSFGAATEMDAFQ